MWSMNQSTWVSRETRVLQDESIRVAAESSRERGESAIGAIFKPALGLQSWPSWEALPAQRGTRWLCHCQKVILRVCPEDKSSRMATGMMEEGRVHRSRSWERIVAWFLASLLLLLSIRFSKDGIRDGRGTKGLFFLRDTMWFRA